MFNFLLYVTVAFGQKGNGQNPTYKTLANNCERICKRAFVRSFCTRPTKNGGRFRDVWRTFGGGVPGCVTKCDREKGVKIGQNSVKYFMGGPLIVIGISTARTKAKLRNRYAEGQYPESPTGRHHFLADFPLNLVVYVYVFRPMDFYNSYGFTSGFEPEPELPWIRPWWSPWSVRIHTYIFHFFPGLVKT